MLNRVLAISGGGSGFVSHFVATRFGTAVDFFNQVNLLYGTLTEFCTPENCPTMSAGPKYYFELPAGLLHVQRIMLAVNLFCYFFYFGPSWLSSPVP